MAQGSSYGLVDGTVTGTISATDALGGTPAGTGALISTAPTANSFVAVTVPGGTSAINVQITGTMTGAYYFEYSMDSTNGSDGNWTVGNFRLTGSTNTALIGGANGATLAGVYRGDSSGMKMARVRNIGGTTPNNPIIVRETNGSGSVFLNASIPAGSNIIGKVGIDQTTPGTTNAVSVTNASLAVTQATAANLNATVAIAAAQTLATVTTVSAVTAITNALPAGTNNIGKVTLTDASTGIAFASASKAAGTFTFDITTNPAGKGILVFTDLTVLGASSTVTTTIQSKDPASGKFFNILVGAAISTVSSQVLKVYPGLTAVANSVASDVIPSQLRISVTVATAASTISVGYALIP